MPAPPLPSTYLVVGNQDQPGGEGELHAPVGHLLDLPGNRGVAADAHDGRAPPVRHACDQEAEGLFGQGHIGVEKVTVDPVQRRADPLRDMDAGE